MTEYDLENKTSERSSDVKLIYKDKNYIVAVKEPGMLAELSGNSRSLPLLLSEKLKANSEKSDIYTVHRLDRNVGGLTLVARNERSASYFSNEMQNGTFIKVYLAVIYGSPEEEKGIYTDLLFRDASKNKTFVVDRMRKGVRDAKLSYEVIEKIKDGSDELSLVKIRLYTGRTHQIRAQFSSRKLPLVGDGRYGSRDKGDSPALYSAMIKVGTPGGIRTFTSLPPNSFPWNRFTLLNEEIFKKGENEDE